MCSLNNKIYTVYNIMLAEGDCLCHAGVFTFSLQYIILGASFLDTLTYFIYRYLYVLVDFAFFFIKISWSVSWLWF
jgi:hypothetical protein